MAHTLQGETCEKTASGCPVSTPLTEGEYIMAEHHQPPQEERHPELSVRRADLTVRIVLWIVIGVVAVALTLWWFLT
jgi:hypothetical protein